MPDNGYIGPIDIKLSVLSQLNAGKALTKPYEHTDYKQNAEITPDGRHFLYFAFGSNLLAERLHLMNPSAQFVTTGRLE